MSYFNRADIKVAAGVHLLVSGRDVCITDLHIWPKLLQIL